MTNDEIYSKFLEQGDFEGSVLDLWDSEVREAITDSYAYKVFELKCKVGELYEDVLKNFGIDIGEVGKPIPKDGAGTFHKRQSTEDFIKQHNMDQQRQAFYKGVKDDD